MLAGSQRVSRGTCELVSTIGIEFLAARQHDFLISDFWRSTFVRKAAYRDHVAKLDGISRPPSSAQTIRASGAPCQFWKFPLASVTSIEIVTCGLINWKSVAGRLLEKTLEREGYEVIAVDNGRSALQQLSLPDGPRLALLDWMMPELDGPGVCLGVSTRRQLLVGKMS
jgi:hypothetical protein